MNPRLLAATLQDLDQAVAHYEAEEPGLGFDFEDERHTIVGPGEHGRNETTGARP